MTDVLKGVRVVELLVHEDLDSVVRCRKAVRNIGCAIGGRVVNNNNLNVAQCRTHRALDCLGDEQLAVVRRYENAYHGC